MKCTVLAALLVSILTLACAAPAEPAPGPAAEEDSVPALLYRRLAYDAFAWHDGEGRPIEEIWFPGRGIVCNVTEEYRWEETAEGQKNLGSLPELHAFFSPILNRYPDHFASGTEITAPTTEIRVPRALAERIFRMADLDRELREGRRSVGKAAMDADLLHFVQREEAK